MTETAIARARRFSVAPMMDWTDRHCRFLHRLMSREMLLFTEMVTGAALRHGEAARLIGYNAEEHPVALQLGGSDLAEMVEAAQKGEAFGYDEININVGCPSDRVQSGRFGACLMAEPQTVAACVAAMKAAVRVPITVKCRIGIDDQDPEVVLDELTAQLIDAGVDALYVHARKAWLKGLSPKENRDIPPLDYTRVYRLKASFPELQIMINGGIEGLHDGLEHLRHTDGIMLGRQAYHNPWLMSEVDEKVFGHPPSTLTRREVVEAMIPYMRREVEKGVRLHAIAKHMIGLYQGLPGARNWRRTLSDGTVRNNNPDIILEAADAIERALREAA